MTTPARMALLVMDLQKSMVDRVPGGAELVGRLASVVAAARLAGVPIIYVVVRFRAGFPEVSEANRQFVAVKSLGVLDNVGPATQVHPQIQPAPDETVVTKLRVSAFAGSGLEIILRAACIECLVLAGIATSGVVLSTVRDAADRDYRVRVLSDGCLDADPDLHDVLMEKVFPQQTEVLTTGEWIRELDGRY